MFRAFLALLLCLSAHAGVHLATWTPPGFKYSFILPVRNGETAEHAVGRYQGALNMSRGLRENLMPGPLHLEVGKVTGLSHEPDGPRAIIPANKYSDMLPEQAKVQAPARPLVKRNIKPYVLPLAGAELGLSRSEAEEARRLIRDNFDLYLGMGGDDIAPWLYGRQRDGARGNISYARDLPESKLQVEFTEGNGFSANFCRSHQLFGVGFGCSLVQDIPTTFGIENHADSIHKIYIDTEASEHLAKIFGGQEVVWVNSLHHESIDTEGNEFLRVVARDRHGVVEAVELRNGRGIGVQFHPELMHPKVRDAFYDYLEKQARLAYARRRASGLSACPVDFARLRR